MQFTSLDEWLAWLEQLHPSEIDLGLDRVRQVSDRLGIRPGKAKVITVAGTNGKGSTLAFLESILLAAGYRVAKYTSPHLLRFNERICINGKPVDDAYICAGLSQVEQQRNTVSLTYFEFTTLAAFTIFQHADVDVWLLEIGLGGRLDAVNIVDPDCAVITNIGLDHKDWLGDDREQIGREKAGVLRAGVPAVFGAKDIPHSVQQRAEELGINLCCAGRDYDVHFDSHGWELKQATEHNQYFPFPGLKGVHQINNAATAIMALHQLRDALPVNRSAIEKGLIGARLKGRFQQILGSVETVLDVAHNPEGAEVLFAQLESLPVAGKTLAIFSALSDKDVVGMVRPLQSIVDSWYLVGNQVSRGQSAADIAAQFDVWQPQLFENAQTAWQAAREAADSGDRILIYGSFYLVSDLLQEVEHG